MSLENHPNFHAIKFTTNIVSSLHESLRGVLAPQMVREVLSRSRQKVVDFVGDIEEEVDRIVAENTKADE